MPLNRAPMLGHRAVHKSHRRRHVADAQLNALLRKTYYLLACMIATALANTPIHQKSASLLMRTALTMPACPANAAYLLLISPSGRL